MKTKLITITLMSILLVACGKSEEEKKKEEAQAQLVAMQIESNQKQAVMSALSALSSLKGLTAEYYSINNKCPSDNLDITKAVDDKYMDVLENISITDVPNGCQLKGTFKESTFIPDMSKESMIITMTLRDGAFHSTCEFTGKNKRDIPKSCR